ncbi:MAG: hypothetical protein WA799_08980 [Nitrosotalea sp.]
MTKTGRIRIEHETIKKLDNLGKNICEETGVKEPTYTQIIEYLLRKSEKK